MLAALEALRSNLSACNSDIEALIAAMNELAEKQQSGASHLERLKERRLELESAIQMIEPEVIG